MPQQPWMSVVIPAYNEERAIGGTVVAVRDLLRATGKSFEIIVVDNASDDGTVERVHELFDDDGHIRVLSNEVNRGKGFSVRRGMLEATGGLRLMCDADCESSLTSLPEMIDRIERGDAEVVAGSREAEGADVGRTQPIARRIASWNFLRLCKLIMHEPLRDIFCGFKLWSGDAAVDAFSRQTLEGWTFDIEVLALARGTDHRVVEQGIAWNDREGSRLQMHRVLVPVVVELLRARANVRRSLSRAAVAGPGAAAATAPAPAPEPLVPDPAEPRS